MNLHLQFAQQLGTLSKEENLNWQPVGESGINLLKRWVEARLKRFPDSAASPFFLALSVTRPACRNNLRPAHIRVQTPCPVALAALSGSAVRGSVGVARQQKDSQYAFFSSNLLQRSVKYCFAGRLGSFHTPCPSIRHHLQAAAAALFRRGFSR